MGLRQSPNSYVSKAAFDASIALTLVAPPHFMNRYLRKFWVLISYLEFCRGSLAQNLND